MKGMSKKEEKGKKAEDEETERRQIIKRVRIAEEKYKIKKERESNS